MNEPETARALPSRGGGRAALWVAAWAMGLAGGCDDCDGDDHLPPLQPIAGQAVVVDSGGPDGDTGWWPSIVIDPQGAPHVAYCDAYHGDLRYATSDPDGRSWQVETVMRQGAVGKYTSIGRDPQGTLGIAFYDQDHKYLRYAWRPASPPPQAPPPEGAERAEGAWWVEKVAWGLEVGMAVELRFASSPPYTPHLFYYIPSGKLVHAWRDADEGWLREVVDEATGSFSVTIDVAERPDGFWISYVHWTFKTSSLRLARPRAGGGWITETLDEDRGSGWRSQLVFLDAAPGARPLVAYTRNHPPELRLARHEAGAWTSRSLLPHVSAMAAAQTPDGLVVAYEDIHRAAPGKGILRLLRQPYGDDGSATRSTLDAQGPTGQYVDLALDGAGRAWIPYYAVEVRGLKVFVEDAPERPRHP